MPRISGSITIDAPPSAVFEVTNDIERWSEYFGEYAESRVLSMEEAGRFTKLVFSLTNKEGSQWRSWRLLDHQDLIAVAEREDPLYPFVFMHLKWLYEPEGDGTRMTWIQDFELDPAVDKPLESVCEFMRDHTEKNQQRFKQLLEHGTVKA